MEQIIKGLPLSPIRTPWTEYAWKYSDFPIILEYFRKRGCVVLGGDILTMDLDHTYDNWYYNPDDSLSPEENVWLSCDTAENYLAGFQTRKGTDYYIVFVI